jgi:hypothetical protein
VFAILSGQQQLLDARQLHTNKEVVP